MGEELTLALCRNLRPQRLQTATAFVLQQKQERTSAKAWTSTAFVVTIGGDNNTNQKPWAATAFMVQRATERTCKKAADCSSVDDTQKKVQQR